MVRLLFEKLGSESQDFEHSSMGGDMIIAPAQWQVGSVREFAAYHSPQMAIASAGILSKLILAAIHSARPGLQSPRQETIVWE